MASLFRTNWGITLYPYFGGVQAGYDNYGFVCVIRPGFYIKGSRFLWCLDKIIH